MQDNIKRVSYKSTNSYETRNSFHSNTKYVWTVFHGIGYLSKYFLKYFEHLNADENYLIAPQAPSKYYLKDDYKYVGASWLTKVDTQHEIANNFSYLDAVAENEKLFDLNNLLLFGFSQGVSILTRWMASRQIKPRKLILYAGGIPNELTSEHFDYLDFEQTEVILAYGRKDPFLYDQRLVSEQKKIAKLFKGQAKVETFDGGHEIVPELITRFADY